MSGMRVRCGPSDVIHLICISFSNNSRIARSLHCKLFDTRILVTIGGCQIDCRLIDGIAGGGDSVIGL